MLYRYITHNEIEATIVFQKSPGPYRYSVEFYQTFKELTPIFFKLFHKRERERKQPNSFYEARVTFICKLDRDTIKKRITGQSL
jgi:hypothetical protein